MKLFNFNNAEELRCHCIRQGACEKCLMKEGCDKIFRTDSKTFFEEMVKYYRKKKLRKLLG